MSNNPNTDYLITYLYKKLLSGKKNSLLKDTTSLPRVGYDCYVNSTITEPLSFTIFELSKKGELLIDDEQKLLESKGAFFLFINPESNIICAVENTTVNKKRLLNGENIENVKVKIIR